MSRVVLCLVAGVVGISVAWAQSSPIEQRNSLMKTMYREGWRPLSRMVKGEEPYEQAKGDAAFAKIGEVAGKLPPLWPAGSTGVASDATYRSSEKIWQNKSDFEGWIEQLGTDAKEQAPKAKDVASLKAAFEALNKTCDGCHDDYRVRAR